MPDLALLCNGVGVTDRHSWSQAVTDCCTSTIVEVGAQAFEDFGALRGVCPAHPRWIESGVLLVSMSVGCVPSQNETGFSSN